MNANYDALYRQDYNDILLYKYLVIYAKDNLREKEKESFAF